MTEHGQNMMRRYRLGKYQSKVNDFYRDEDFKSTREEIAVCRMVLQEILEKCAEVGDFIIHADQITKMVDQINKLVVSMHKIEVSTGQLLNRASIIAIADRLINVLSDKVDHETLKTITGEVESAIFELPESLEERISA